MATYGEPADDAAAMLWRRVGWRGLWVVVHVTSSVMYFFFSQIIDNEPQYITVVPYRDVQVQS